MTIATRDILHVLQALPSRWTRAEDPRVDQIGTLNVVPSTVDVAIAAGLVEDVSSAVPAEVQSWQSLYAHIAVERSALRLAERRMAIRSRLLERQIQRVPRRDTSPLQQLTQLLQSAHTAARRLRDLDRSFVALGRLAAETKRLTDGRYVRVTSYGEFVGSALGETSESLLDADFGELRDAFLEMREEGHDSNSNFWPPELRSILRAVTHLTHPNSPYEPLQILRSYRILRHQVWSAARYDRDWLGDPVVLRIALAIAQAVGGPEGFVATFIPSVTHDEEVFTGHVPDPNDPWDTNPSLRVVDRPAALIIKRHEERTTPGA